MTTIDIGLLNSSHTYKDSVLNSDPFDVYKFKLDTSGNFKLSLNGLSDGADVQLLDNNGKVLYSTTANATTPGAINAANLLTGDYSLKISQTSGDTDYNLSVTADPITGLDVESGYFTVGSSGQVGVDFPFDGGAYTGELAIFNLKDLGGYEPGSEEFIKETARKALSNSTEGHIVISDITEGAKFSGSFPWEENYNSGEYKGIKTFTMTPGDKFGVMLIPNGTVKDVFDNPAIGGDKRPLYSIVTANPNAAFHVGQIADINGAGSAFTMEDLRVDTGTDKDYNDIIFQFTGATGKAVKLDDVIDLSKDWRGSEIGKKIIDYIKIQEPSNPNPGNPNPGNPNPGNPNPDTPKPIDPNQPLIGIIDTGFSGKNPDIDYKRTILGHDFIGRDNNPLLETGENNEHGSFVLGLIGSTQGNGIGIDGINDKAQIWLGRAVGSGEWAKSLREFVDTSIGYGKKNAVVNLSLDLTQTNPDGTVTTRYELTPDERKAIEYARQNGVLLVVAAGNDGGVMSVLGQASQEFDNIITVGSAKVVDSLTGQIVDRAEYSSYGNGLDILADGGTIENPVLSTMGEGMGTMAGTSVAAAKVTGVASLMWAKNPDLNFKQVIEILKSTATDLKTPGWDAATGKGLLNQDEALKLAQKTEGKAYKPEAWVAPETWSGEGKVTPGERAAQDVVADAWKRTSYYGWLDNSNPSDKFNFTLDRNANLQFSIDFSQGTAKLYGANGLITTATQQSQLPSNILYSTADLGYGSYSVVVDKGGLTAKDPYKLVLNFDKQDPNTVNRDVNLPKTLIPGSGEFISTVTSNGVTTNYYKNGYQIEMPFGLKKTWYEYGKGIPMSPVPTLIPNLKWSVPGFWQAQFVNHSNADYNDLNSLWQFGINRANGQLSNTNAVVYYPDEKDGGKVLAHLHKDFALGTPTNNVQSDYYTMLASTQVHLDAGKLYKFTTQSDDGVGFHLKNADTGEWIQKPGGTEQQDWRDRGSHDPANTNIFDVKQSGNYDIFVKYYEKTGGSVVDVKLSEVQAVNTNVDLTKDWKAEVYWWNRGENPQATDKPPGLLADATPSQYLLGTFNLGSNKNNNLNFNWGIAPPNQDYNNFPNDSFVVKAYTQVHVDATKTYSFSARGDDGFRLFARPVNQPGAWELITPITNTDSSNWWQEAYGAAKEYKDIKFKNSGDYMLVALMYDKAIDANFNLSWKDVTPPVSSGNYYPELSSNNNDWWDIQTGDDIRFDGNSSNEESIDEIKKIYADLSTAILGSQRKMNAGYLYDQSYYNQLHKWHSGIDFKAKAGDTVKAAVDGKIVWTDSTNSSSNGYFIAVEDKNGKQWVYGHLQSLGNWKTGKTVKVGDQISTVGSQLGSNAHFHLAVGTKNGSVAASKDQNLVRQATMSPLEAYWLWKNS